MTLLYCKHRAVNKNNFWESEEVYKCDYAMAYTVNDKEAFDCALTGEMCESTVDATKCTLLNQIEEGEASGQMQI